MRELKERVVVYWSRRFYERERHEHARFLDFLEKLKKSPSSFRVTQRDIGKLSHFLKKDVVNAETGKSRIRASSCPSSTKKRWRSSQAAWAITRS